MLLDYEFDIPELSEQKSLADKLWAAYKLKTAKLKLIAAINEMVKSQFIEMFGAMSTTPVGQHIQDSYPGEWGVDDVDGTGVKVIRTTNFTNTGKLNFTNVVTRKIEEKKVNRKRIQKYDTILERSGGTADNPVGRVVLFEEDDEYLCNNFTQVLRFKDIDSRFAFYALYYFYQTNKTAIRGMGNKTTGIQNLNMAKYMEIGIPNASDEQQKAFVTIAEQADKSKFVCFKSQFIEMFGGDDVERVELSSVCSTFIDGDWIESKDQSDSGIRLVQTSNIGCGEYRDKGDKAKYITEDTFNKLHCTEIFSGDILISRLPDPVGRACILPNSLGKCITAVDCTIIRLSDKMLPKFFVAYTNTTDYLAQIKSSLTGTTRLRVSRTNLGKVRFPLPSIEQQQAFVAVAEQADKSKYSCRNTIKTLAS